MLIFICCPKSFDDDEFYKIQRNAILSWQNLTIEKKIVIVGDEDGNEDFCKKNNLIYEPNVVRNEFNTPILPSIFKEGFPSKKDLSILKKHKSIISSFDFALKNPEKFDTRISWNYLSQLGLGKLYPHLLQLQKVQNFLIL